MKTAFLLKDIFSGGKDPKLLGKKGLKVEILTEQPTVCTVRPLGSDRGFSVYPKDLSQ
jgi:hypothetical protein